MIFDGMGWAEGGRWRCGWDGDHDLPNELAKKGGKPFFSAAGEGDDDE